MQFIEDSDLRHESSSSAASASSASARVSPPNSSTSPPPYSLPLPPTLNFSPSPTPIPANGPTVELPRRRRGRPPGSKNKPKSNPNSSPYPSPNPFPPFLRTLHLQVDPDRDVVETLTHFCRTRSISLSVLSASGFLSQFVLRHPSSPSSNLAFRGRFEIISISATVIDSRPAPSPSFNFPIRFTVMVTGPHGQVLGGPVNGPLVAAGPVFIVAASSSDKPTYHRLPEMEEEEDGNNDAEVVEGNKRQQTGLAGGGGTFTRNLSGSDDAVWGSPVVVRPPY
ncbi:hypothetical protein MLD38_034528 [Melastoma candidum]|uniref:Uncharacterized protein n=1 Tax=Melastoma candidum TaxID=119954 RepID=A0ACB9MAV1_9MYRT|nr:hypothetical protein MLD38_034528 [Melastoma candidum]